MGHVDRAEQLVGVFAVVADGGESVTVEDDEGKMIDIGVRLGQIYDQLTEINAASAEGRAAKILSGLGFTPAMQGRATKTFSGGWRMRISLARALFIQPTLLLLVSMRIT